MKPFRNIFLGLALAAGWTATPLIAAEIKGDYAMGKDVYEEICFSCHGEKGDGKGPSYRNTMPYPQVFANSNYMKRLTPQYIFDVVKYGKLAVIKGEKQTGKYEVLPMPGFEDSLEDEEIRGLMAYEKSLLTGQWKAPKGSEFTREEMKEYFDGACAECHGPKGKGNGPKAIGDKGNPDKPFVSIAQPAPADQTDRLLMARFNDEFIFWLIKKGRIAATEEKNFDIMKPYGHVMSDEEIWSVVKYVWTTYIDKKK